jgi:hypothetical protein
MTAIVALADMAIFAYREERGGYFLEAMEEICKAAELAHRAIEEKKSQ